jgi:hypothetical protein
LTHEPTASRDGSVGAKPQLGVKWEEMVTTREVGKERRERVVVGFGFLNENLIAFEKAIAFVTWEIKVGWAVMDVDRLTHDHFSIILQSLVIGPCKFT